MAAPGVALVKRAPGLSRPLVSRELVHRLQQAIAAATGGRRALHDQAVVAQRGEQLDGGLGGSRVDDGLGVRQVEARAEDRQLSERFLLVAFEQCPGPADRVPDRLPGREHVAPLGAQQVELLREARQQLDGGQKLDSGGSHLDGQGKAIHELHTGEDRFGLVGRGIEVGPARAHAIDEQLHGFVLGQGVQVHHSLAGDTQRGPGGPQDPQRRTRVQQRPDRTDRTAEVFEVVQDNQGSRVGGEWAGDVLRVVARRQGHVQLEGQGAQQVLGSAGRAQIDEDPGIAGGLTQDGSRQPRLADTGGAAQRDESRNAIHPGDEACPLGVPAHEGRALGAEGHAGIWRRHEAEPDAVDGEHVLGGPRIALDLGVVGA